MSDLQKDSRRSAPKLQLSNSYPVDFGTLARVVHIVCTDARKKIPRVELAAEIGIAPAKAENLASIAQGLGLINPNTYTATKLGRLVKESDPFFDDVGTLWFLHYCIASEPRHLVWNRFANAIVPKIKVFDAQLVRSQFSDLGESHSRKSSTTHVQQEVKVVLDAYTCQSFNRLGYLRANGNEYGLGYREPVPPLVLAASIARFRDRHRAGETALPVADLLAAPNSPGVIFQLGHDRLRAGLEELKTQPGIALESRADLDQIRLTDETPDHVWMERYYASR